MKPEVNAILQEVKQNLANPLPSVSTQAPSTSTTPDFGKMTAVDAVRWCLKNGITKAGAIAKLTGKNPTSVYTAMWKVKHPKRSKRLNRESKARREVKIMLIKDATKSEADVAKPIKIKKPKIENGLYDDGMETPFLDAMNRQTKRFNFLDEERQPMHELVAENRRLKILVEHYESLLFKGGK